MTLRRAGAYWGKKNNGSSLPYTPPLDVFNNSIAAYSVRKLRSAYTGPCMKVGTTLLNGIDIGFDANGLLDTAAITNQFGNNNIYIEKWYDQSTMSNDLTGSATLTSRKLIFIGGTGFINVNGIPSVATVNNQGASSVKSFDFTSSVTVASHFAVGQRIGSNTLEYIGWGSSSSDGIFVGGTLAGVNGMGVVKSGSVTALVGNTENINQRLWCYIGGTPASVIVDGTVEDTATISDPVITEMGRTVEFGGGSNFSIYGHLQEMLYFSDYKTSDRASIESNINSYFSIY